MNCVPLKLHFMHYGSNLSYCRKFPMVLKTATISISNHHHQWLSLSWSLFRSAGITWLSWTGKLRSTRWTGSWIVWNDCIWWWKIYNINNYNIWLLLFVEVNEFLKDSREIMPSSAVNSTRFYGKSTNLSQPEPNPLPNIFLIPGPSFENSRVTGNPKKFRYDRTRYFRYVSIANSLNP